MSATVNPGLPEIYISDDLFAEFAKLYQAQQKRPQDPEILRALDRLFGKVAQIYKLDRREVIGISAGGKIITKYHQLQEETLADGQDDGTGTRLVRNLELGILTEQLRQKAIEVVITNSEDDASPLNVMMNFQNTIFGIFKDLIKRHELMHHEEMRLIVLGMHCKTCEECTKAIAGDGQPNQQHIEAYLKKHGLVK